MLLHSTNSHCLNLNALVAIKLKKFVNELLDNLYPNVAVHLWSDSQIVLHWIGIARRNRSYSLFPTAYRKNYSDLLIDSVELLSNWRKSSRFVDKP